MNTHDVRSHFNLTTTPFTREIPVEKRFDHPQFDGVLGGLYQAVVDRMSAGLIAVSGSGKSVLLRALKSMLPEARFRTHYLKVTSLGKRDMCREIALALGCEPVGQYNTLVRQIQQRLLTLSDNGGVRPVLLVDEAHDMRPDVLAIFRVLCNFDMDSRLVVSVILCGQKSLAHMLRRDDLEAVSRRLSHVATLRNLGRGETRRYVEHRLTIAGAQQNLFTDLAHDAIFEIGHGNLRATDQVALKALQLTAVAGETVVDNQRVADARKQVWL